MLGIEGHTKDSVTLNTYAVFEMLEKVDGKDLRKSIFAVLAPPAGPREAYAQLAGGEFIGVLSAHTAKAAADRVRRYLEEQRREAAAKAFDASVTPSSTPGGAPCRCHDPQTGCSNSASPEGLPDAHRINAALAFAWQSNRGRYEHSPAWIIDQMVRALTGTSTRYADFVESARAGPDGADTYRWDCGV